MSRVFLFTDIEGSAARWESKPDAMRAALAQHDAIVRAAIERDDGCVFKTVGDAFCATFEAVPRALDAALRIQRELGAHDWSAVNGLRVRIAIADGEVQERDGDYFGSALNRVARLLAAGWGGQILVAGSTAAQSPQTIDGGSSLRALGTFRLRDLEQPEPIYQLVAPDLPDDFKPIKTLDAIPNNLPKARSPLVGRDNEVAAIAQTLERSRMVSVTGTGGVGKTRVAIEAAVQLIGEMPDGAWFVNLAPVKEPDLVASTILSALGATQTADRAPLQLLLDYLKTRRLLLVVDNCEHLVHETAAVCAQILAACAHVTILATSREALRIAGEQVYRLPSLDVHAAVQLFAERARASAGEFTLTVKNTPAVEEICRRLDGIALAIELAAARSRLLTPETLLQRLNDRFRLLTGGSRDALPRHQTMRALIDWSYELLGASERALFRRLSVFNGGFTLDAAAAVCADGDLDEWTILEMLTELTDKSLVIADQAPEERRFHLLQCIREFAREELESNERFHMLETVAGHARERLRESGAQEERKLRDCHAAYFTTFAEKAYAEWEGVPRKGWVAWAAADLNNYRSALTWTLDDKTDAAMGARLAAACASIFMRLTLLREGIEWCERALAVNDRMPPKVAGDLYYGLSMLRNNQGAIPQALDCAKQALPVYEAANDPRGIANALSQITQLYASADRRGEAAAYVDRSIEAARSLNDPAVLAVTLRRCASALPPDAIRHARTLFEESVSISEELDDRQEMSRSLIWWADAEMQAGCADRAIEIGRRALEIATEDLRLYIATNLAGYFIVSGDAEGARELAAEGFRRATEAGHDWFLATASYYLAAAYAGSDGDRALRLFGFAKRRIDALAWQPAGPEFAACDAILHKLRERYSEERLRDYLDEGARFSLDQLWDVLTNTASVRADAHDPPTGPNFPVKASTVRSS